MANMKTFQEFLAKWKPKRGFKLGKASPPPLPSAVAPLPGIPAITSIPVKKGFNLSNLSSFDWEKIYRKSFLYNSLAAVVCAYFAADLLILAAIPYLPAVEPPRAKITVNKEKKDISRYEIVFSRNIFNEKGLIPDADDKKSGFDGPPVRTSLPLNLLGVIVVTDDLKSVASVENKGSNQVVAVRVNDSISAGAIVQKIENTRVIFINRNTDRREFIELPKEQILATRKSANPSKTAGIVAAGNNRYAIDRGEVDKTLSNLNEVLTQARCVPNFEGGKPGGFRCFQIVPGSIYDKLGMKDNDVIKSINGQAMTDPSKAFELLNSLKNDNRVEMSIDRNGQVMNMVYDIN